MKTKFVFLFLFIFSLPIFSQQQFEFKQPNIKKLQEAVWNSNLSVDVIHLYFENNYAIDSKKFDIKNDPDFDNMECGFTKKYLFGIKFITNNCGEETPLTQTITFPKMSLKKLKKWVEQIYLASLYEDSKPVNSWIKNKNEFSPGENEAGCSYTIKQTKTNSIVEVWCGC